jgi:hypothetical protein
VSFYLLTQRIAGGIQLINLSFLDDLAELGARTARAPRGMILKRDNTTNVVTVVGRYGTLFEISAENSFPEFIYPGADFISIPDVRTDQRLNGHALLDYVPRINSLIVANISPALNYRARYTFTLFICNSDPQAFVAGEVLGATTHVVNVCRQFISALGHTEAFLAESSNTPLPPFAPFATTAAGIGRNEKSQQAEHASYLLDTLPLKQAFHENDVSSFVSLRTWKKSIKAQQIVALDRAVMETSELFLEGVAREVASTARKIFGHVSIQTVVPLPAQNVAPSVKLAQLISQRVANKLGANYANALSFKVTTKSSKNAGTSSSMTLSPLSTGGVLLLDDFANSPTQIGVAQNLIRESGATCFAISWLAPA